MEPERGSKRGVEERAESRKVKQSFEGREAIASVLALIPKQPSRCGTDHSCPEYVENSGFTLVSIRKLEFIVGRDKTRPRATVLAEREPLTRRFAPPSPTGRGRSQPATRRKRTGTNQALFVITAALLLNALSPRERVREAGGEGSFEIVRKTNLDRSGHRHSVCAAPSTAVEFHNRQE